LQALRRDHPHRDPGRRLIAGALLATLAGCAAVVPASSDEAAFVAAGATRVPAAARAELLIGNRLEGDGFTVTYDRDGTKRIRTDDGVVVERRWWRGADGAFCEELAASAAPVCGGHGKLYVKDGRYRAFRPDGSAAPLTFTIEEGEG
jgi:hypothetical protein